MAISIEEFKKAFADKVADNGLQGLLRKVAGSLKQLNAAVKQSAKEQRPADGIERVLKYLEQRFADVSKSADAGADTTTELDKILRQSEAAIKGLNGAASQLGPAVSTSGSIAQAPPPPAPSPPTAQTPPPAQSPPAGPAISKVMRTGVVIVPDFKGLRTRITDWVAKNISKDRARAIVNLSNLREVHTDGLLMDMIGAEILATVKVVSGVTELERFDQDSTFAPSIESWEPSEGKVPVELEVIDGSTGLAIKGAIARLSDGKPYATDADGLARVELPPNLKSKVDVSANGYVPKSLEIYTTERRWEGAVRLASVNVAALDPSHLTITVIDITEGTPVPDAAVKVGNFPMTTDENGVVSRNLVPGEYPFIITATDFVTETGKIDVRAGTKVVINETIGIKPVGSEDIYVRVLNSKTRKPIADATVRILSQQEDSDNLGEARFLNMPFGEYRLGAQFEGYKPYAETIKHNKKSGTAFREIKLEPAKP